jgi:hypothetical protein
VVREHVTVLWSVLDSFEARRGREKITVVRTGGKNAIRGAHGLNVVRKEEKATKLNGAVRGTL